MAVLQNPNAPSQVLLVDANGNVPTTPGPIVVPSAGGHYTVTGQTSAVVAAALAANTMLMSARFNPSSTRKAYVSRYRLIVAASTLGAAAGVPGTIGLQRFTAQTPTGGTARTVNRQYEALGSATDMTDVRDSNAALTGTAPTFGTVIGTTVIPLFISSGAMWFEWIFEPSTPIVLNAGDGIALRTIVAMAATQTWLYSYTMHWCER